MLFPAREKKADLQTPMGMEMHAGRPVAGSRAATGEGARGPTGVVEWLGAKRVRVGHVEVDIPCEGRHGALRHQAVAHNRAFLFHGKRTHFSPSR